MFQMNRRATLGIVAATFVAAHARSRGDDGVAKSDRDSKVSRDLILKSARSFLVGLLDPELDLLPEYRAATVYWLYHDNYLASKVLDGSHPQIASKIRSAIKREGVSQSGKIELLFGEVKEPLPFRQFLLKDVRRIENKVIRTEVVTDAVVDGWKDYADFLLMACIAEKTPEVARRHWDSALQMWDGKGFLDAAARHDKRYATYKLGLALLAARQLMSKPPAGLLERLLLQQDESGGWITDYNADGQKIGLANVETTCLSILGIESLTDTPSPLPSKTVIPGSSQ